MPTPFRGGVPGDEFFIRFKITHKLSLKKPQSVEACRKKSIDPLKETGSKNVKNGNGQETRKQPRKKKRVVILNN
jgi:hypothetical protein